MDIFLRERLRVGVKAISLRLRLSAMLRRKSLPDLLGALSALSAGSRGRDRAPGAPLPVTLSALSATEDVLRRVPLVPDTCLYRALARYAVLRGAGHDARFVMGVDPARDEIAGHAWVEVDGAPSGEVVSPGLVVTYSYPASAPVGASSL